MEKTTSCPRCQTTVPTRLGRITCTTCGLLIADMTPKGAKPNTGMVLFSCLTQLFGFGAVVAFMFALALTLFPDWIGTHLPFLDPVLGILSR